MGSRPKVYCQHLRLKYTTDNEYNWYNELTQKAIVRISSQNLPEMLHVSMVSYQGEKGPSVSLGGGYRVIRELDGYVHRCSVGT